MNFISILLIFIHTFICYLFYSIMSQPKRKGNYCHFKVNGKIIYWCIICHKRVSHKTFHQQMHDGIRFQCPDVDCTKSYSRKSAMRRHYQIHHMGGRYVCSNCHGQFTSRYYANKHECSSDSD